MSEAKAEKRFLPWERRALGIIRRRIRQAVFRVAPEDKKVSFVDMGPVRSAMIRVCNRAIRHGIMEPSEICEGEE